MEGDHNGHGDRHGMPPGQDKSSGHDAHDKHAGHSPSMFRDKFWLSLVLSVPTLVWSPSVQEWLGFTAPDFPLSQYIPVFFGTAVFLYGGLVFLRGAIGELKDRLPGMMTLISLAISVAFVYSLAVTFGWPGDPLWWELATLVTIMILGHWIEMRSIGQARGALKELAKLLPDLAVRIGEHGNEEVPVAELRDGDLVLVRPGASVPAWRGERGPERGQRIHDHGRVAAGRENCGGVGGCGHGQRLGLAPRRGHSYR